VKAPQKLGTSPKGLNKTNEEKRREGDGRICSLEAPQTQAGEHLRERPQNGWGNGAANLGSKKKNAKNPVKKGAASKEKKKVFLQERNVLRREKKRGPQKAKKGKKKKKRQTQRRRDVKTFLLVGPQKPLRPKTKLGTLREERMPGQRNMLAVHLKPFEKTGRPFSKKKQKKQHGKKNPFGLPCPYGNKKP